MSTTEPYTIEILLARGTNTTPGTFDLDLIDRDRSGIRSSALTNLDFAAARLQLRDGSSVSASEFCNRFLRGESAGAELGLAFGRLLRDRLFENGDVAALWSEIQKRRGDRRLRVELILPDSSEQKLADLPFELLADADGFLFRRFGHTLIRTLRGFRGERVTLGARTRVLCAWANPRVESRSGEREALSAKVFTAHEDALREMGSKLGWEVLEPCGEATRDRLAHRLTEERPALVSLIAHGPQKGGAVYLHNVEDPDVPRDLGTPLDARALGHLFKSGGVRVALLWSCHGGKRHPVGGAVAEALLRESDGGLAAVLASHAALRADGTGPFARALLEAWGGVAAGDLERAVTEARSSVGEDDLQWAAPVYYARPLAAQSVTLEERVRAWAAEPGPAPKERAVEGAPRRAEHFRGREGDRQRIAALLRQGRLVSVVGMPGIGKTELILAVASDLAPGFERACWFSLDGLGGIEPLRAELASRFGRRPDDCKEDRELAAAIGGTRVLMVLDNAEDLVRSAADRLRLQSLLDAILRDCPGLCWLISSRRPIGDLREAREETCALERLPSPHDLEAFVTVAGARLSPVERASEDLVELVKMLDGHPQSLVLVAGQVGQGASLRVLRERLVREGAQAIVSSELLDEVDLDQVPDVELRAKRLVSSLNLSFLPLKKANLGAAEMFTWLGHFPSGVPEVLLAEIFGKQAEERAAALERLFLLEKSERDQRVRLPAPMRWYARKQQESVITEERRGELLTRSWDALARLLIALHALLPGEGSIEACKLALLERDNFEWLISAVELNDNLLIQFGGAMAASVTRFVEIMMRGGYARAALPVAEEARDKLAKLGQTEALADVLLVLGDLYIWIDRSGDAEVVYGEALAFYHLIGNAHSAANVRKVLGDIYSDTQRLEEAESAYQEALLVYRVLGDDVGQANALRAIGGLHLQENREKDAEAAYDEALSAYRAIGDRLGEANTLLDLGHLCMYTERLSDVERFYKEALSVYRKIGARPGEANALMAIGQLYVGMNRFIDAEAVHDEAILVYREIGDRQGEACMLEALGSLYRLTARTGVAAGVQRDALAVFRDINDLHGQAKALHGIGQNYLAEGKAAIAFLRFSEALKIHREISDKIGVAMDCVGLAQAACAAGHPERAVVLAGEALIEFGRLKIQGGRSYALICLGNVLAVIGDVSSAFAAFILGWHSASMIGDPRATLTAAELREQFYDFDPSKPPSPEQSAVYERQLADIIAVYEARLHASGEDPYSPLPPAPPASP